MISAFKNKAAKAKSEAEDYGRLLGKIEVYYDELKLDKEEIDSKFWSYAQEDIDAAYDQIVKERNYKNEKLDAMREALNRHRE